MRVSVVAIVLLTLVTSPPLAAAERTRPATHRRVEKPIAITAPPARAGARHDRDRSIGAPWSGRLQAPARFEGGARLHLRRPWRAYATRTTVQLVRRALTQTLADHPRAHVLAIGDLSAERGGRISEHASHQSGRDIDVGLFYKQRPRDYPASFVRATWRMLDAPAMWRMVSAFARTAEEDGGVQVMFLDYELQAGMYGWARRNGVSEQRLATMFQYPRGRGAAAGLIRHVPHHDDHLHVRFKCRVRDTACR